MSSSTPRNLLLIGLGLATALVLAAPLWVRYRLPVHATPAAVERACAPQLRRLRELALDYEATTRLTAAERAELLGGLFASPALLEATVVGSEEDGVRSVYPIKLRGAERVGDWRLFDQHPAVGGATVTPVHADAGLAFEYRARLSDAEGRPRGYTLIVDGAALRDLARTPEPQRAPAAKEEQD